MNGRPLLERLARCAATFALSAAVGCTPPFGPDGPGWVVADVVAWDTTSDFDGVGTFELGHPSKDGWGVSLVVSTSSDGDEGPDRGGRLRLQWRGDGLPRRGHYDIELDHPRPHEPGFAAAYAPSHTPR